MFNKGIASYLAGHLPEAIADFERLSTLDPRNAYAALWLDVAARRAGRPSSLQDATARIDMAAWPAPLIRLYLGQLTPDLALAEAVHPDPAVAAGQVFEADFFAAEYALLRGAKGEALRLFHLASSAAPPKTKASATAGLRLRALGSEP